jgi:hypothetical protein
MLALSNYDTGYRAINVGLTLNNVSQIWQPEANALKYDCKGMTGSWNYSDGGDKMKIVLNYQNNTESTKNMSFDFNMTGGKQVMWTKDSVYNTEGFLPPGGPGNVSF